MRRQGGRVKSELQQRVDAALMGGGLALGSLAFVAVLREGIETALFLYGAEQAAGQGLLPTVLGGLLGLSVAAVLGYLLYRGGLRLNLRVFFRVTGVLIIIVAAGLFAFSVHELQEAGWLPFLTQPAFDISHRLSDENGVGAMLRALIGYNDDPSVLEVIAWASYLLVAGFLFLRPTSTPAHPSRERRTIRSDRRRRRRADGGDAAAGTDSAPRSVHEERPSPGRTCAPACMCGLALFCRWARVPVTCDDRLIAVQRKRELRVDTSWTRG